MIVYYYDKTLEGLLTAIFDAYSRRVFPDKLMVQGDIPPMFTNETHTVVTNEQCAARVWRAVEKKLSRTACNMLTYAWLSEEDGSDETIFRYICKTIKSPKSVELNFGDADVLKIQQLAQKTGREYQFLRMFVRFQKAADDIFFAPVSPKCNALPLAIEHFRDRFSDQKWVIYDIKRRYGFYYDMSNVTEITIDDDKHLLGGKLDQALMAEDEKLFQDLWRGYFNSMTIKERISPRLQRHNMPKRFWKYLTEIAMLLVLLLNLHDTTGKATHNTIHSIRNNTCSVVYTPEDIAIFEKYMGEMGRYAEESMGEIVIRSALFFTGTPYVAGTLESEQESLTVNLREMDCVTFMESVLALSRTLKKGESSFADYCDNLREIRYRNGEIGDYSSRLHYTSDWLYDNEKKGILKSTTGKPEEQRISFNLNIMTSNLDSYKQLKDNPELVEKMRLIEKEAGSRSFSYFPKDRIGVSAKYFDNGDIVAFLSSIAGIDVAHTGIIYFREGEPTLIHASSRKMEVTVEELSLEHYCLQNRSYLGILVAKPM